jgi:hypothetical protein
MSNEQLTMKRGIRAMNKIRIGISDFWLGVICGALAVMVIVCIIAGLTYLNKRDKELIEYAEKQIEIENLREDIINRPADEFLEIPDVRRAADGARGEFDRKRDEILERFRSRYAD